MTKDDFQINTENLKLPPLLRMLKRLSFGFNKIPSRPSEKTRKKRLTINSKNSDVLCIEISSDKINMLLEQRLICAADIRCLDNNSQSRLKNLCLRTCLYNTPSYLAVPQLLDSSTSISLENHES
jgi:hypothetical protein